MDDLVRWLGEQLDKDERIVRAATQGEWVWSREFVTPPGYHHRTVGPLEPGDAAFIAAHNPARVLREIEAKRQLVVGWTVAARTVKELGTQCEQLKARGRDPFMTEMDLGTAIIRRDTLYGVLRLPAVAYADRPGYREDWRPS